MLSFLLQGSHVYVNLLNIYRVVALFIYFLSSCFIIDVVLGTGSKEIIVLGLKKFNLAREVHIPAHFE